MPAIDSPVFINKANHKRDDEKPNIDSASSADKPFREHLQQEIDRDNESITAIDDASAIKKQEYSGDEVTNDAVIVLHNEDALVDNDNLVLGNELPPEEVLKGKNSTESVPQQALNITVLATQERVLKNATSPASKSEELLPTSNQLLDTETEFIEPATNQIKISKNSVEFAKVEVIVNESSHSQKSIQTIALNTSSPNESVKNQTENVSLSTPISTPLSNKKWGNELAQKINVMVESGQKQVAELRLNPANLGPLSVRLNLDEDQASISFLTNHQAVKEAIEASIPRLREQLQQQGLDLTSVNIEKRNQGQGSADDGFSQNDQHSEHEVDDEGMQTQEQIIPVNINAGVSVFV